METQGSRTAAVTKSQELTRVIHQMFAAIPQPYIHRHVINEHLAADAPAGGYTQSIETKLNTT